MVELERLFPGLRGTGYRVTSQAHADYNCIAWAAGDCVRWWEPDEEYLYFWPQEASRQYTVRGYTEAFLSLGFEVCQDGDWEEGKEKVAIFADPDHIPTHAARQLADGAWTSKLGQLEDIRHREVNDVGGTEYGEPVIFLRRQRIESEESSHGSVPSHMA